MKSKMFKKLMAAAMATAMTVSLAACGEKPVDKDQPSTESGKTDASTTSTSTDEGEVSPYPVINDPATGKPYDLGGMDIIIRNWWSDGTRKENPTKLEQEKYDYIDWCQETYNFTIKEMKVDTDDWGSIVSNFQTYASNPDDGNAYLFTLRPCPEMAAAISQNLMYDLATLDCLDFSSEKISKNGVAEAFTFGDKIYAMYAGDSEPRTGIYFNRRILKDAGIDPDSIYELQKQGKWTWEAWEDMMKKVQDKFTVNGERTVYGCTANNGAMPSIYCASNGTEMIGKDADGKYVLKLEDDATKQALEFMVKVFTDYSINAGKVINPETGEEVDEQWDHYKNKFVSGKAAFMTEDGYAMTPGNFLTDPDNPVVDDYGFAMFPQGPRMDHNVNVWSNNPVVIPANYSADKAWKIAFAWNLYTELVPGQSWTDGWISAYEQGGSSDAQAIDTAIMMANQGTTTFHDFISGIETGPDFLWKFGPNADVTAIIDGCKKKWQHFVDKANGVEVGEWEEPAAE